MIMEQSRQISQMQQSIILLESNVKAISKQLEPQALAKAVEQGKVYAQLAKEAQLIKEQMQASMAIK